MNHSINYNEYRKNVDTLTNTKQRYIPFKLKGISNMVDNDPIKEDIVYVVGLLFIVLILLRVLKPYYIMEEKENPYGMNELNLGTKKWIKWGIFWTLILLFLMWMVKGRDI